jgi:hypothetical protein
METKKGRTRMEGWRDGGMEKNDGCRDAEE